MIKLYIKQAFQSMRENPLVSTISIAGTALSIAMIMVVVMLFQIKSANYPPESKRDRMLYVPGTRVINKEGNSSNNGNMSSEVVKECFYTLKTPEAVTAIYSNDRAISLPEKRLFNRYTVKYTDPGFWKVFDFRFTQGAPFTAEDFASGLPKAVVTEDFARKIYGTKEADGKLFVSEYITFTIVGVVKPVSLAAKDAYGDIWIPYSSITGLVKQRPILGNMAGPFTVCMLAKKREDFQAIRDELTKRTKQYNAGKTDWQVGFLKNPITKTDIAMGSHGFNKVPAKTFLLTTGSLILFLLLVPVLNLTGVVQSSVQKREEEIGLRKAFGATNNRLLTQLLNENLVLSLLGGAFGLLLSLLFIHLFKGFLLGNETMLTFDMLFKPGIFVAAFLFTILLNLLSAGWPAYRIAQKPIVSALSDPEK